MRYLKTIASLYFLSSLFFCLASVLSGFTQRPWISVLTGAMAVLFAAVSSVLFQKAGSNGDRSDT